MQGRDQTNVCTPVVTFNFAVAMVPVQKDNRLPLASPKAPVDSFGFGLYLGKEVVIALNMRAAWGANLHKGELLPIEWIFLQHSLNSQADNDRHRSSVRSLHRYL